VGFDGLPSMPAALLASATAAQRALLERARAQALLLVAAMKANAGYLEAIEHAFLMEDPWCILPGLPLSLTPDASHVTVLQRMQERYESFLGSVVKEQRQHDKEGQRILDELHAAFALPEVERATELLPELVGLIGEFLSADSHLTKYVSIHALPNATQQGQQQQQQQSSASTSAAAS
jgi:hypothetical protein